MKDIIKPIKQFFKDKSFKKIYVGFSGGADSTCLLLALNEIASECEFKVIAVHFEHGLRGRLSIDDANWCKEFCSRNFIEYIECKLGLGKIETGNVESLARKLRFDRFAELIKNPNEEVVALGHHSGDRVENLFIRLFRGANVSSLTSLRKVSELYGIKVIRPLIDFSKKEIECFLKNKGINDWRVDHTNAESDYRRNFFRNKIFPLIYDEIPNAEIGINRAIDVLSEDAQCLEEIAGNKFLEIQNKETIDVGRFQSMHRAVLIRVLRYWLSEKLGYEYIPDRNFIERFYDEIKSVSSEKKLIPLSNNDYTVNGRMSSLGGVALKAMPSHSRCLDYEAVFANKKLRSHPFRVYLLLKNNELTIYREPKPLETINWDWGKSPEITVGDYKIKADFAAVDNIDLLKKGNDVFFDAEFLPNVLIVRSWRAGDKMIPFGKNTPVKLKKIFVDRKISSDDKNKIPLLSLSDNTIIWILGVRRSNFAVVKTDTKQIVSFKYTV